MIVETSWTDIDDACRELARKIEPGEVNHIVAVMRGGLVPATILSHLMRLPLIAAIHVSDINTDCPTITRPDILVIDDICDTGGTFRTLRESFPNALFAALYVKPASARWCQRFARAATQDAWLRFPWEIDSESMRRPHGAAARTAEEREYDVSSKSDNDKIVDVAGEVVGETERAFRFDAGNGDEVWLPKSLCEWDEHYKTMALPEWLAFDKGLI